MPGSVLSPQRREDGIGALRRGDLDLLVIGGGVVGAGTALDAATRGMTVGLVEASDWASGTSSRSTKLIHGGLRYLQLLDFALVREALIERGLLLDHLAPHLVQQLRFLYPLRHRVLERAYTASGIALYDALGRSSRGGRTVPRQRQRSRRNVYRESPALRRGAFHGGIEYFDAQVDDARFVLTIVRTALSLGAHTVNRMRATELLREGGRVVGARLVDHENGEEFVARGRSVVVATGAWRGLTGSSTTTHEVRPSKGVHLVVPRDRIDFASAVVTRTAKSVLFVIPWGDHWIIGTTDTPWDLDVGRPVANSTDIDYLLTQVNSILERPLGRSDVKAVYSGLRPLLAARGKETVKSSREHAVDAPEPGLFVVSGGKFTTYRVMARDVVDAVRTASHAPFSESNTASTPLVGAAPPDRLAELRREISNRWELPPVQAARLVGRYGTLVDEVLAPGGHDRSLLEPLIGGDGHLLAELRYAATAEGALHLDDALLRRIRLDIESTDRGRAASVPAVAALGDALGWSVERRGEELDRYEKMVTAEIEAEKYADDRSASARLDELNPTERW